jgi:hypothetical protein
MEIKNGCHYLKNHPLKNKRRLFKHTPQRQPNRRRRDHARKSKKRNMPVFLKSNCARREALLLGKSGDQTRHPACCGLRSKWQVGAIFFRLSRQVIFDKHPPNRLAVFHQKLCK